MSKRKILIGVAVVVAWFAVSLTLLFIVADEDTTSVPCPTDSTLCGTDVSPTMVQVPCPSEDSCTVDYHDGAYHFTPAVP